MQWVIWKLLMWYVTCSNVVLYIHNGTLKWLPRFRMKIINYESVNDIHSCGLRQQRRFSLVLLLCIALVFYLGSTTYSVLKAQGVYLSQNTRNFSNAETHVNWTGLIRMLSVMIPFLSVVFTWNFQLLKFVASCGSNVCSSGVCRATSRVTRYSERMTSSATKRSSKEWSTSSRMTSTESCWTLSRKQVRTASCCKQTPCLVFVHAKKWHPSSDHTRA